MSQGLHAPSSQTTIMKFSNENSKIALAFLPTTLLYNTSGNWDIQPIKFNWKKTKNKGKHYISKRIPLFSLKSEFIDQDRFQNVFSQAPTETLIEVVRKLQGSSNSSRLGFRGLPKPPSGPGG